MAITGVTWRGFASANANAPGPQAVDGIPALGSAVAGTLGLDAVRLVVNASWWDTDVPVAGLGGTPYVAFIQEVVSWIEADGLYVVLAPEPGAGGKPCLATSAVTLLAPACRPPVSPLPLAKQVALIRQFWKDATARFSEQPAVLFEAWRGFGGSLRQWRQVMPGVVDAIRSGAPGRPVVVDVPPGAKSVASLGLRGPGLVFAVAVLAGSSQSPRSPSGARSGYGRLGEPARCSDSSFAAFRNWPAFPRAWLASARRQRSALVLAPWGVCGSGERAGASATGALAARISSFARRTGVGAIAGALVPLVPVTGRVSPVGVPVIEVLPDAAGRAVSAAYQRMSGTSAP